MITFGADRRRRPLRVLLLVGAGCAAIACSQRDTREEVRWFRDLYGFAKKPDAHPLAKEEIMVAEKTDRVLVRDFGAPFTFAPVDLPKGTRVELRYRILSNEAYPH